MEDSRERRTLAVELGRPSGGVGVVDANASTDTRPSAVREPEMTTTATPATQSSVLAVPATQSSPLDTPMDTAETTSEPARDLVLNLAVLAQPASERTYDICGLGSGGHCR